ncbi:zinc-dependent alcohol dehydrogenase [Kineococcus rhizosphaerae]|uniref:L-iditol 2-dehydrogenase n=1 Tax=Kineococcus rhizosphaerae TaxID=559628 RepID=A0A2T0QXA7_9ACTN|nr:zinc-binding dehydrogenase [Kineococcus rhizosphaerae]PRY10512.1 L-iditol 2-dehydrogenase [Kineococcus rhizosphaerae]
MKALQFTGDANRRVVDLDTPRPAADEVLVAARSVGICHSDVELLEGRYIIPFEYPVVPGHEWAGEVVARGEDVTEFAVGDRVIGECVIGTDHFGFSISGAAAEFFLAKPSWLHRVPDTMTSTQAALVEPFSCGYYAVTQAGDVDASDTVVVLGAGPIGLGVVAAAAGRGARVVVVDRNEDRLALAGKLGADEGLTPGDDLEDRVRASTSGRGADVVVEASGSTAAMASALRLAGFRARLVNVGIDVGGTASAELGLIQAKELTIRGTIGSPGVWARTLRFLERTRIDLSPLVTASFPLARAEEAVDLVHRGTGQVKVHLTSEATL